MKNLSGSEVDNNTEPESSSDPPPLKGIRVLDFSTLLPGPICSLLLAEAGAEVLKIERPVSGDDMRHYDPLYDGVGVNFVLLNRGKTSQVVDLKTQEGISVVKELVESTDILIEQFRPGVMQRLGLGYEDLIKINPTLVYCSISGYGQSGPYKDKAGHDLNYVAQSGLLSLTEDLNGAPLIPAVLLADIAGGGLPAFHNILLALIKVKTIGKGCHLDISMTENLFLFSYWAMAQGQATGHWPEPSKSLTTGGSARYQIYKAKDGRYLATAPLEEKFWITFCEVVGVNPTIESEVSSEVAIKVVQDAISKKNLDQWMMAFEGKDVCVTPVRSMEDAMHDPHFLTRGVFDKKVQWKNRIFTALPVPLSMAVRDPGDLAQCPPLTN